MLEDLIQAVSRGAELPADRAALAVNAMLRYLTARLPSSLVGELHARLNQAVDAAPPQPPEPSA